MAKKFAIPFAQSGDKTVVPVGVQPDGSVSYTAGFGHDYELDKLVDPVNAKDVPRDQTNQLFFDVTEAVGEIQKLGYAMWSTDLAPYALNADVFHNGILWRSTSASNSGEPGVANTWTPDSPGATSVAMTNANVTLTVQQAARSIIIITGTLTADVQLIFPAYAKRWTVINSATGNFAVICKTASGFSYASLPGTVSEISGDGSGILSGFASLNAGSGWAKSQNGSIIQWGSLVQSTGGAAVTFPIVFPRAVFQCVVSPFSNTPVFACYQSSNTTGLFIQTFNPNGTPTNYAVTTSFLAVGY